MDDTGGSTFQGTQACADYVKDETEGLMLFVTALEFAEGNDRVPPVVAAQIAKEPDPRISFRAWFDRQIAETLLTRTAEGFLAYLAGLLALVYEANPNALPREMNIPASLALELEDRGALTRELAGRRIRTLARKGIGALNRPFEALHFPLYRSTKERASIGRALAQRDLIVHSRGIVDRAYLRKVPGSRTPWGEPLPLTRSEAVDDSVMLMETAIRVDRAAVEGWKFDTVPIRAGSIVTR